MEILRAEAENAQEDLSTEPHKAQAVSRLSSADEYPLRTEDPAPSAAQGPLASYGLSLKREGLSRAERLSRKRDFERVFREGQRLDLPYLRVIYAPNNCDRRRIGFAVSKKVGKAVVRNRIKRLLRETFRRHKEIFPPHCDFVFIPRREVAQLSPPEIARDLAEAFQKCSSGSS